MSVDWIGLGLTAVMLACFFSLAAGGVVWCVRVGVELTLKDFGLDWMVYDTRRRSLDAAAMLEDLHLLYAKERIRTEWREPYGQLEGEDR